MYNVVKIQLITTSIWAYSLTPWPFYYVPAWKIYFTLDVLLKLVTHTTDIVVLIYKLKIYLSCDTMVAECMGTDHFFSICKSLFNLYLLLEMRLSWHRKQQKHANSQIQYCTTKDESNITKVFIHYKHMWISHHYNNSKTFYAPLLPDLNPDLGGGGGNFTPSPCWASLTNSKTVKAVTLAFCSILQIL